MSQTRENTAVAIIGVGGYVPSQIIENSFFVERNPLYAYDVSGNKIKGSAKETSGEWIEKNMGVVRRHWACEDESVAYMAYNALRRALDSAELCSDSLDGIVVATVTGRRFPSVASSLDAQLGSTKRRKCYDIGGACAGSMIALEKAYTSVAQRGGIYAVIGAEALSRVTDVTDKNAPLFGDGAGAFILQRTTDLRSGIVATESYTVSDDGRNDYIVQDETGYLRMPEGPKVFSEAVRELETLSKKLAESAEWNLGEVDCFLFHQANRRISEMLQRKMNLRDDQLYTTIGEFGNTSSASIPLAYARGVTEEKITPGSKVIMASIGSGMSLAGAAVIA